MTTNPVVYRRTATGWEVPGHFVRDGEPHAIQFVSLAELGKWAKLHGVTLVSESGTP